MYKNIKLIAMDLDGTLTQHKEQLDAEHRASLDLLAKKYRLVMVGAGQTVRIFNQMNQYPIDIIGNYGFQYAKYNEKTQSIETVRDEKIIACDVNTIEKRVDHLRKKHGFTEFRGNSVEYHPSGCVTFAILGTDALQPDKLAFDPDRSRRRAIYREVCELFPEYFVFIGGSSSFDMSPRPYNKRYALELYCKETGISPDEAVFIGDDYGEGGNDESVYRSDFNFIKIDDYRDFSRLVLPLL